MIYVIYALYMAVVVLLGVAVWRVLSDDRSRALKWIIVALVTGLLAAVLSWSKIGGEINATGYARVKAAAAKSNDADAMAQWALGDNSITVSEYSIIAQAYQNETGSDINEGNDQ